MTNKGEEYEQWEKLNRLQIEDWSPTWWLVPAALAGFIALIFLVL